MAGLTTIWLAAAIGIAPFQGGEPARDAAAAAAEAELARVVTVAYQQAAQTLSVTSPPEPGPRQTHETDAAYEGAGGQVGSLAFLNRDAGTIHVRRPEAFRFAVRQELLPELKPVLRHVVHEGVRQFLLRAFPQALANPALPAWLEEGLCEYLSSQIDAEAGSATLHTTRTRYGTANLRGIQRLFREDKVPRLGRFLGLSRQEFAERLGDHTKIAWAIVYYLWNAPGAQGGGGEHAGVVRALLDAFSDGLRADEAYARAWSGRRALVNTLQQGLEPYYRRHEGYLPDRTVGRFRVRETEHYTMYLDTSLGERATEDLLANFGIGMELMFVKYGEAFQYAGKLSQKAVLRVYPDRQTFQTAEGVSGGVAAFYRPDTKELVGFQTPIDAEPNFFHIFCHEGSHQFFDIAFPGFYKAEDLPMWFSEGMGDALGSSWVDSRRNLYVFCLDRGVARARVANVKAMVEANRYVPLRDLVTYDRRQFYGEADRIPRALKYAQAWSFLHFLWMYPGYGESGEHYYRGVVIRLVHGFKAGRPRDEVYEEAFRHAGRGRGSETVAQILDRLEGIWKDYVSGMPDLDPR